MSYAVVDNAGNQAAQSYGFTVSSSFTSIRALIRQLAQSGQLDSESVRRIVELIVDLVRSEHPQAHQDQTLKEANELLNEVKKDRVKGSLPPQLEDALKQNIKKLLEQGGK